MSLKLSVVLTTHNRADLLPRVLGGLAHQTLERDRFEVVAIDDGSNDATSAVLEGWKSQLPLRVVRQAQAGLAAAKNLGLFMARGEILLFADDDDVAEPDLLVGHLAAHILQPHPAVAVLGRTALAAEIGGCR